MGKRVRSALLWVIASAIICGDVLGILYGLVGKVDFTVRHLSSTTTSFPSLFTEFSISSSQPCVGSTACQCSAYISSASSETTSTMRPTFPEYVVAALCVQYEAEFRPNITIVVKALQPLLHSKPVPNH